MIAKPPTFTNCRTPAERSAAMTAWKMASGFCSDPGGCMEAAGISTLCSSHASGVKERTPTCRSCGTPMTKGKVLRASNTQCGDCWNAAQKMTSQRTSAGKALMCKQ